MAKDWEDLEFQMDFWVHAGTTSGENFSVDLNYVTHEDIKEILKIANDFFIPWITSKMNKDIKKKEMKLYCMLLSVTFSVISHFQSSHNV
jgi:hypothetical protein